jgi:urea carboxylase
MWNRYNQTQHFTEGKPWLLRFFDQLKFHPVSHEELMQIRQDFPNGHYDLKIEETELDLKDFHRFIRENKESIEQFKSTQQRSFDEERARWEAAGQAEYIAEPEIVVGGDEIVVSEGCEAATSPVAGSIWKLNVEEGQSVTAGDVLIIVESMKMEIPVVAETDGVIQKIFCSVGAPVKADQILLSTQVSTDNL